MKMTSCYVLTIIFILLAPLANAQEKKNLEINNMKPLKIQWYRLMSEGQTCPRCGATEKEVEQAYRGLEQSLSPLGIKVILEKYELTPEVFKQDPSKSNILLINRRPLEEWLGLKVGQSLCCGPCGDVECRTLETGGQVYETIPAELIIKAGLISASHLLNRKTVEPSSQKEDTNKTPTPACCPK